MVPGVGGGGGWVLQTLGLGRKALPWEAAEGIKGGPVGSLPTSLSP